MKLPRPHHLSPEKLAGQLLMPALHLEFLNAESPAALQWIRALRRQCYGGFILFDGHPADVRYWTGRLSSEAEFPLLFGADLERGLRTVFSEGVMLPHQMVAGAGQKPAFAVEMAQIIAEEARAAGINLVFAPVLDLADDPENPIVNIRAFHSDPKTVARYGEKFITALQKTGIAAVAKHFPGHGSTGLDSHTDLPVLQKKAKELEKADLIPFAEAVSRGVKGIMVGHLIVAGSSRPASLESEIIGGVLRQKLGFKGVVFTDALEMGAIKRYFKNWEQAVLPIAAGADILLMPENPALLHRYLVEQIRTDEPFRRQAELAVERVFALKKWLHRNQPRHSHPNRLYKKICRPAHLAAAAEIAESGITLVKRSRKFPFNIAEFDQIHHFVFTDARVEGRPLNDFYGELHKFFERAYSYYNPSENVLNELEIGGQALTVISVYSRTFAGHVPEFNWRQIENLVNLVRALSLPIIVFLYGNPHLLPRLKALKRVDAVFLAYSYVAASQKAAFKAMCGFMNVAGQCPVPVKRPFKPGIRQRARPNVLLMKKKRRGWQPAKKCIREAIQKQYFPGGVLTVCQAGSVILNEAFGRFDYSDDAPAVTPKTSYDLASLTKVLATTPAVLKLIEQGKLSPGDTLIDFYPRQLPDRKIDITIGDLLAHQSGLPAWRPFYESCRNRQEILLEILRTPLEYLPGKKSIYSDLGFMLLADIVEHVSGKPFDEYCRDEIFRPLNLKSMQFNPPEKLRSAIPPTGFDKWRKKIVQGEVNDTNCYVSGGVAGHAGLFGNALEVAVIAEMILRNGCYGNRRLLWNSTIGFMSRRYNPAISSRAVGWDTPTAQSSCGRYFSASSIGHTGFTGTSLWIDLDRKVSVVFLSNRTHPDPAKNPMVRFRRQLHDAVMKAITR